MPNPIKYTTGSETLALKKGNFYIGTGDVGKGPSDTTGYYQGPSPASGGYVIYLNKSGVPGNLSYHSATNDGQLISFTNNLAGTSFTSATQCLNYFATQTDKVCFNRDYEGIVTNGLVLNLDAGFTPSYSRSGTTWYDISLSGNTGTLTNGPTFSSDNSGSIVFDGSDDYSVSNGFALVNTSVWSCGMFVKATDSGVEGYCFGWDNSSNSQGMTIGQFGGRWISHCRPNSNDWINGPLVTANAWINIFVTYDGTTQRIYSNGNLFASKTIGFATPGAQGAYVGALNRGFYFNGSVGICQFYTRVLTASEVLQNYNAQKGRFGL